MAQNDIREKFSDFNRDGQIQKIFYTRSETCYLSCYSSLRIDIYHGNFWAYFTAPLMRAYHCLIDAWKRCLPLGG